MHGSAKLTDALAMNDAEFMNTAFAAEFDVIEHDGLDVLGAEGVEIKDAINGQIDWIWNVLEV